LIWFIWFVLFIWLVAFNQTNQTDQINKRNQPVLALYAPWSMVQAASKKDILAIPALHSPLALISVIAV
jgi:hypothetical protein